MKLQFKVLGFTLASIELELPAETERVVIATALDKGVHRVSNWWLRRLSNR